MNLSLLAKWRWRILQNESSLWREVVTARYGDCISFSADWSALQFPSNSSNWWKDLSGGDSAEYSPNWVAGCLEKRIGTGQSTRFWLENWIGGSALCDRFLRLYSLSVHKEMMIGELGVESLDCSRLVWRRRLFQWEEERVGQLIDLLREVRLTVEADKWVWLLEEDGSFSVKTAYDKLVMDSLNNNMLSDDKVWVFDKIWSSPAPSKTIAFSWQLLYDRLPSKSNLARRGVAQFLDNQNCMWCTGSPETGGHLLLHCNFAQVVWREVSRWLELNFIIPPNLFILFRCFAETPASMKLRKGLLLIWHSTLWLLWKARNSLIFKDVVKTPTEVFDEILVTTWKWSLHRLNIEPCLLYEWQRQPRYCLMR
jgi:hypothetical protein